MVEHATAGVVVARDQHSDELAEAIAAGAALPASPAVARALNAEADANNKLEAARAGLERLIADRHDILNEAMRTLSRPDLAERVSRLMHSPAVSTLQFNNPAGDALVGS